MRRSDAVEKARVRNPAGAGGGASRALLALQCVSACAGTTLGATVGSGAIGKLITSAGGALITAFLTAPGRHHPRRIVAVGLVLALLDEGKALAATVRRPRARRARTSVFPRPAGLLVTTAVGVIGFTAGWAVATSPFVASPRSGETGIEVAMRVASTRAAPTQAHAVKRATTGRAHSTSVPSRPTAPARPPVRAPSQPALPKRVLASVPPSAAPTLVLVPSVSGQALGASQKMLRAVGLASSTSSQPSSTLANGVVISSNPAGGSRVAKGSAVQLVVSSGPVPVAIPDVTGKAVKVALAILRADGFLPTVSLQSSQTVPSGQVITTTPTPATPVAPGSPVTVLVSS